MQPSNNIYKDLSIWPTFPRLGTEQNSGSQNEITMKCCRLLWLLVLLFFWVPATKAPATENEQVVGPVSYTEIMASPFNKRPT